MALEPNDLPTATIDSCNARAFNAMFPERLPISINSFLTPAAASYVKLKSLAKEYAFSNNPYKIGDVVIDKIKTIKIEKIQFTLGGFQSTPECVYTGIELTKKGDPNKKGNKRSVYQSNIITP